MQVNKCESNMQAAIIKSDYMQSCIQQMECIK